MYMGAAHKEPPAKGTGTLCPLQALPGGAPQLVPRAEQGRVIDFITDITSPRLGQSHLSPSHGP